MSTTAWSALADRFRALAGEQEFCFRTYPSDSRQPFLDDEGRFRFVYPFGNAPGTLQHYGVVIGDGTATGEEFARVNRFRWLAPGQ